MLQKMKTLYFVNFRNVLKNWLMTKIEGKFWFTLLKYLGDIQKLRFFKAKLQKKVGGNSVNVP